MKQEYINKIVELLNSCCDIELLDLVYQLLVKSMKNNK